MLTDTAHAALLRLRCSRGCDARGLVMADDRSGWLCMGCVMAAHFAPLMGDIGDNPREIELEPFPEKAPQPIPLPTPAPIPAPVPEEQPA